MTKKPRRNRALVSKEPGSDEESPEEKGREYVQAILRQYKRDPTNANLERILAQFERMIRSIVNKYSSLDQADYDDLLQVGRMALVSAAKRFDLKKKLQFSTYAYHTIKGEILHYFRDVQWAVNIPRRAKELVQKINRVHGKISSKTGRSPTVDDLAEEIRVSPEEILEAQELASAYNPSLLVDNIRDDSFSGISVEEERGGRESRQVNEEILIEGILSIVSKQEHDVLKLRFVEGYSQREIAKMLHVNQMHISRVIRSALAKIRESVDRGRLLEEL